VKYRHAFHAGNFADVHKHVTLVALLQALARKDKGFLYLDTHGGRGAYDLAAPEARRGIEAESGIGRVLAAAGGAGASAEARGNPALAPEIAAYLDVLQQLRAASGRRSLYPGSPLIAAALLRPQDRGVCLEAQPDEYVALRGALRDAARFVVEHGDGYAAITARLPPIERRALVLIDPPYEDGRADQQAAAVALAEALRRLPNAVVAIWYPIKLEADAARWVSAQATALERPLLCAELWIHPRDSRAGLNGSGMLIANPPWQLEERMQSWLPQLHRQLDPGRPPAGGCSLRVVVGRLP
jgi:23S rRNA (adenine2030-N6)-methyltransferase